MTDKTNKAKGINLAIQETRQLIAETVNSSGLPPACLMLILGEFVAAVASLNEQCIRKESEDYYKTEKEETDTEAEKAGKQE